MHLAPSAIRCTHGCRATAPALPRRDRRGRRASPEPPPSSGVTQPAVSRTLAALEDVLGVRLLRRTSREVVLTAAGERVLARSRRVLAEVEDLVREARSGAPGCASATPGRRSASTRWSSSAAGPRSTPTSTLHLVRTNSPTGGLAEGACDVAVVRTPSDAHLPDPGRFDGAVVGLESRFCALAADDPLARRRQQLRLADLADRVVAVDPRTGTTTADLWPPDRRPPDRGHPRRRRLARRHRHRTLRRRDRREHPRPSTGATASSSAASAMHRRCRSGSSGGAPTRIPRRRTWSASSPSSTALVPGTPDDRHALVRRPPSADPGNSRVAAASAPSYRGRRSRSALPYALDPGVSPGSTRGDGAVIP